MERHRSEVRNVRLPLLAGIALVATCLPLAIGASGCSEPPDTAQSQVLAAHSALAATGVSDDMLRAAASCTECDVTARVRVNLPLTGKTVTQAKLRSKVGSAAYAVGLQDDGEQVDADALIAAEGRAKIARQGKLRDDLYATSLTSSTDVVPIWIWADFKDDSHVRKEDLLRDSALAQSQKATDQAALRSATGKVTAWLDARGYHTYDRGLSTPRSSQMFPSPP